MELSPQSPSLGGLPFQSLLLIQKEPRAQPSDRSVGVLRANETLLCSAGHTLPVAEGF